MSALVLLLLLLLAAYFGSLLLGGRALGGYGLPSGCEWLVLGFVLGPSLLNVASQSALSAFQPVAGIAMAWIALVLGAEYGYAGERRIGLRGFALGITLSLATAAFIAAPVYFVASTVLGSSQLDSVLLGVGVGLASCETARYAVRWAAARSGVTGGPLFDLLEDMADTDEVVPLVGMGVLLAFAPSQTAVVGLSPWHWLGITLGIGVALGLLCSLLIRGLHRVSDAWGVLVGAALLGTGIAWRLGLSPLCAMFVLGVTLTATSRHAAALRPMLARTESAFLLPTLLLAGALVRFDPRSPFVIVIVVALGARIVARTVFGYAVGTVAGIPKHTRGPLALGLWSTGALTTLVALSFAFRFGGAVGDAVVTVAFGTAILGELVGPLALLRAFSPSTEAEPQPPAQTPAEQAP